MSFGFQLNAFIFIFIVVRLIFLQNMNSFSTLSTSNNKALPEVGGLYSQRVTGREGRTKHMYCKIVCKKSLFCEHLNLA